ncbi:hypothetical protein CRG98_023989 [Punica granatum]|uniref:non-specific serine/threonine protein kinase n=1 Tax=Punica granatum TaxID=22663 RepID=A0A2I0JJ32_PUNGR|nr:hypothetical protein CRG98_023989 [Punica granatum]
MKFCSAPLPWPWPRFLLLLLHLFFFFSLTSPSLSLYSLHPSNLTLYGDAYYTENSISLTQNTSSCTPFSPPTPSFGRALYSRPIRFLNPPNNSSASFSTRFTFLITGSPLCPFGDGLAFLITSDADSFSPSNGYMGLPAPSFEIQDSSYVAVEFDTSFNPTFGDVNGNHIGIDLGSVTSFDATDAVSGGIDLKSRRHITAWVEYRSAVKLLQVWAAHSNFRPQSPVLVAQIDLSKHFREFMHVGFSASNGQGSANHIITNWRFGTFGFTSLGVPVNSLEGGDCLMCFPEQSSIEMDGSDLRKKGSQVQDLALGLGGLAALIISIILIVGAVSFYLIKKSNKSKERSSDRGAENCVVEINKVPTKLSLAEIREATMGFNRSKIIGEGASATVYQGTLPGGTVAVKRFDRENRLENNRTPFTTEFATMVGCLRHKNLVQLQGWCCEGSELLLIYEYLPNGSLDKILHGSSGSSYSFLTWEQRKKIILGVASALTYLHEECERQIIHRDVKTCNIMLDSEFNAKLGDFGLAEVYEHSCRTRAVTIPAGTMGYLAPEYVYFGVPTVKTDVYSFGVVVLEVATGLRPVEESGGGTILVDWVWDLWEKGRTISALDSKLRGKCNEAEAERMLMVGLCCVNPAHDKRPSMKEAARILKGEVPVPRLPARKPTVRIGSVLLERSEEILNLGLRDGDETSSGYDDLPYMTPKSHFG